MLRPSMAVGEAQTSLAGSNPALAANRSLGMIDRGG